jgi:hypothetical protein
MISYSFNNNAIIKNRLTLNYLIKFLLVLNIIYKLRVNFFKVILNIFKIKKLYLNYSKLLHKSNCNIKKNFNYKGVFHKRITRIMPYRLRHRKRRYNNKFVRLSKNFKMLVLNNRRSYKKFFLKKALKQVKLNKYFNHKSNTFYKKLYSSSKLNILSILFSFGFFLLRRDLTYLLKNNFFFLNGLAISKSESILNIGDILQCMCSKKLLVFSIRYITLLKKNLIKFKFKFARRGRLQKNNKIKRLNTYSYLIKLDSMLEVDYITYSIVVVKKPQYIFNLNRRLYKIINILYHRTYN